MCGGGPIFSICYVWSLTQCHSWNSLPCNHQQTLIITTYRPPATTISFYSTSSSPENENPSSNRLGTHLSRGVEKPRRAFGPSTHYRITFRAHFANAPNTFRGLFTDTSQTFCRHFEDVCRHFVDVSETFRSRCEQVSLTLSTLPGHFSRVLWTFPECSGNVSDTFCRRFADVSSPFVLPKFQARSTNITVTFRGRSLHPLHRCFESV